MSWEDLGDWLGGLGKALAIAAAIVAAAYVAGQNIPPSVSASMDAPKKLKPGEVGDFTLTFTTSPGSTPLMAITEGSYEIEIKWDPANSDPFSGFVSTTGTWKGTYSSNFMQQISFDADGTEKIEWDIWLYGSSQSATSVASASGSWNVLIKQ